MILEIILAVIVIISIYVNWNLFRKTEKLEEANEEAAVWIDEYSKKLNDILSKIREIDSKKMFETDDDVGSIFAEISKNIKELEELKANDEN